MKKRGPLIKSVKVGLFTSVRSIGLGWAYTAGRNDKLGLKLNSQTFQKNIYIYIMAQIQSQEFSLQWGLKKKRKILNN